MSIELISKRELNLINRKNLRYHLAIAEKDYFLALVSKIIYDSLLRHKLIFKGGTAIHHCYLPQYRFSEDLDFSAVDKSITLEEMKAVLEVNDFIKIKKEYISKATIKFEKVQYTGPLGLPNCLKVETDFVQNVVLPAKRMEYKNVWNVRTDVMVMDVREICAEKIRATSDRARYRDFYDLYLLRENYHFDLAEILALIQNKEIRKSISKENIIANLHSALTEKQNERSNIFYAREVRDEEITQMIHDFAFTEIRSKDRGR